MATAFHKHGSPVPLTTTPASFAPHDGQINNEQLARLNQELHGSLLNKSQLAARLGVTVRGVECLVAKRRIPVIRLGHRTVKFSWPKVEAALAKLETREI